jgi:hypothetical protein
VIGGLGASLFSTLFILSAVFVLISPSGTVRSDSLDPDVPESLNYDRAES